MRPLRNYFGQCRLFIFLYMNITAIVYSFFYIILLIFYSIIWICRQTHTVLSWRGICYGDVAVCVSVALMY